MIIIDEGRGYQKNTPYGRIQWGVENGKPFCENFKIWDSENTET
jgi:hypothetical protein